MCMHVYACVWYVCVHLCLCMSQSALLIVHWTERTYCTKDWRRRFWMLFHRLHTDFEFIMSKKISLAQLFPMYPVNFQSPGSLAHSTLSCLSVICSIRVTCHANTVWRCLAPLTSSTYRKRWRHVDTGEHKQADKDLVLVDMSLSHVTSRGSCAAYSFCSSSHPFPDLDPDPWGNHFICGLVQATLSWASGPSPASRVRVITTFPGSKSETGPMAVKKNKTCLSYLSNSFFLVSLKLVTGLQPGVELGIIGEECLELETTLLSSTVTLYGQAGCIAVVVTLKMLFIWFTAFIRLLYKIK